MLSHLDPYTAGLLATDHARDLRTLARPARRRPARSAAGRTARFALWLGHRPVAGH